MVFSDNNAEAELPFDLVAAIYGTVTGLVLVMFILVLYRTVSESVEDTGKSRFNRLREPRGKEKSNSRKEISCPECDQRLHSKQPFWCREMSCLYSIHGRIDCVRR